MQSKTRYFFVRHGETDWNVQRRIQGHTDIPLNDTGKEQAAALKKVLEGIQFSACFSSDLQRASETACIIVADHDLEVMQQRRFRESHYGAFEGVSWEEFNKIPADYRACLEEEKRERIKTILADKASNTSLTGNVLIVTHGGFMSSLLAVVLDLPLSAASSISIDNTAFIQMYFSGSKWVVEKTEGIVIPK